MAQKNDEREIAKKVLSKHGMLTLTELCQCGVSSNTVYQMVKNSEINRLARGLYQLENADWELHHSLAIATKQFPESVVCLLSALSFYDITDQIPNKTWLAISNNRHISNNSHSDAEIVRYSDSLLFELVEVQKIEGVPVRIFSVLKTIIDCFQFQKKVGIDIAMEGLTNALQDELVSEKDLVKYAKIYGVWHFMQPYFDAAVSRIEFLKKVYNY